MEMLFTDLAIVPGTLVIGLDSVLRITVVRVLGMVALIMATDTHRFTILEGVGDHLEALELSLIHI